METTDNWDIIDEEIEIQGLEMNPMKQKRIRIITIAKGFRNR